MQHACVLDAHARSVVKGQRSPTLTNGTLRTVTCAQAAQYQRTKIEPQQSEGVGNDVIKNMATYGLKF